MNISSVNVVSLSSTKMRKQSARVILDAELLKLMVALLFIVFSDNELHDETYEQTDGLM